MAAADFPFVSHLTSHQSPHLTSHLTPVCHLTTRLTGRRLTFKVGKCKHLKGCLRELGLGQNNQDLDFG